MDTGEGQFEGSLLISGFVPVVPIPLQVLPRPLIQSLSKDAGEDEGGG
jgi:hypothetical protein